MSRWRGAPRVQDWGELLQAGAEIYEYQPAMFHCKMMLVDGQLASVARPTSTTGPSASMTRQT
jgi:hypothetical protein